MINSLKHSLNEPYSTHKGSLGSDATHNKDNANINGIFNEKEGYGAKMRGAGDAMGSPHTFYNNFPTKIEILADLIAESIGRFTKIFENIFIKGRGVSDYGVYRGS